MKKLLMAGNWKMNMDRASIDLFFDTFKQYEIPSHVKILICPPSAYLERVIALAEPLNIAVGAQNMYYKDKGAFTGEISPVMLNDIGVEYVILGHSERREIFGEQDDQIAQKVVSALEHELTPILCVGETLEERKNNKAYKKIGHQLKTVYDMLNQEQIKEVIIAYEPIWAIGTGEVASTEDAQSMAAFIREELENYANKNIVEKITILYGGSVKPDNAKALMECADINGALVGGASLDAPDFLNLWKR